MPTLRSFLGLTLGLVALGCESEAPSSVNGEQSKTLAVVTVDRTDHTAADAPGNASAIARFVSVPAFAEVGRVLRTAGAALELPAVDTCQGADAQEDLDPGAAQDPVELVEAGDVSISASDTTTPLVPHAFPTVGTFASGVLYATRDRESSALPVAVPYVVTTTGSAQVAPLRIVAAAPPVLSQLSVDGVPLQDAAEIRTSRALDLAWSGGSAGDIVYVELMAYDGSPTVVCSFRDEVGAGTIPAETFAGAGTGRLAVHRVHVRRSDVSASAPSEVRFDFQVGASVEFAK